MKEIFISKKLTAVQRDACGKRLGPYEREQIINGIKAGENNSALAKKFNVARAAIARIRGVPAPLGRPRKVSDPLL